MTDWLDDLKSELLSREDAYTLSINQAKDFHNEYSTAIEQLFTDVLRFVQEVGTHTVSPQFTGYRIEKPFSAGIDRGMYQWSFIQHNAILITLNYGPGWGSQINWQVAYRHIGNDESEYIERQLFTIEWLKGHLRKFLASRRW